MWCVVTRCIRCFPKLKETTHSFGIPARHITPFFLWSQEAGRGSVAELSRLPAHPWCQGGHCTPCAAPLLVGSHHNPVMGVCMSSATVGPNLRVLVQCLHGVHAAFGSGVPTAPPEHARPGSRYHHRSPQWGEGSQRGLSLGWSQQGEPAAPGSRGLRRWKELQSHLGDCEAPAKGSSCCAMARMHVAQPALFSQ